MPVVGRITRIEEERQKNTNVKTGNKRFSYTLKESFVTLGWEGRYGAKDCQIGEDASQAELIAQLIR